MLFFFFRLFQYTLSSYSPVQTSNHSSVVAAMFGFRLHVMNGCVVYADNSSCIKMHIGLIAWRICRRHEAACIYTAWENMNVGPKMECKHQASNISQETAHAISLIYYASPTYDGSAMKITWLCLFFLLPSKSPKDRGPFLAHMKLFALRKLYHSPGIAWQMHWD